MSPAGYASTFSNNISGTAGLIKVGAGSLALTGNNSYTGNTYLNGGTLIAFQQANLGNNPGALRFDGGTLKFGADFLLTRDLLWAPGAAGWTRTASTRPRAARSAAAAASASPGW